MTITIRTATADEAATISALALRSKGYWGYSPEFLEACRAELTYTAEQCASGSVVVAVDAGTIVGFYALGGTAPDGELDALFVEPAAIGTGVGAALLGHARHAATERGFTSLTLDADPDAEPFYTKHGAERIGESVSGSVPGRTLPRLRFSL